MKLLTLSAKYLVTAAFLALFTAPAPAQAVVIDFNALTGTGLDSRGLTYSEDRFTLDALTPNFNGFLSIHSPDFRYTGTVSFFNDTVNGVTRLTRIGGGAFDLNSLDLDSLNGAYNLAVTFTGLLADASTVTQTFTTDASFPSLQTFVFASTFSNLLEVRWIQESPHHSFDNIVVDEGSVGVPEPMTLSLFGAGLAGIGALRRRRG